ncbi:MAG: DUF2235 domain-containing protein [Magnetococcus sp. DMHC-1]
MSKYYLYTIKPGDTLYGISKENLGDGSRYLEIQKLNSDVIINPRNIQPGTKILLPPSPDETNQAQNSPTLIEPLPSEILPLLMQDSSMLSGEGTTLLSGCIQKCPLEETTSYDEIFSHTITARLFFDGTGANEINVSIGRSDKDSDIYKKYGGSGTSYDDDFSNIARLWKEFKEEKSTYFDHYINIYTSGIGTVDREDDSIIGLGLGQWDTGVKGKAKLCMSELINSILNLRIPKGHTIKYIHLDLFGFSRGAACARYFIAMALGILWFQESISERVKSYGYALGECEVKFVGLFDTVASFGVAHFNDTRNLELDSIQYASHVFQLAASDEHRDNFRLTNTKSFLKGTTQWFLPGAHADVGGSYVNNLSEKNWQLLDKGRLTPFSLKFRDAADKDKQWFINKGYYKPDEFVDLYYPLLDDLDSRDLDSRLAVVAATRKEKISNEYSFIPLRVMASLAEEYGITFCCLDSEYKIPQDLEWLNDEIDKYIVECRKRNKISVQEDWLDIETDKFKDFRYKYVHCSARYGETLGKDDPNFENGKRKRIIQDG